MPLFLLLGPQDSDKRENGAKSNKLYGSAHICGKREDGANHTALDVKPHSARKAPTVLAHSTLPACEVGQKYYALKKSSPFVNSR